MLSQFNLSGKTALVTGASRGLGQQIALALAEAGANVVCSSSRESGCNSTLQAIREIGGTAHEVAAKLDDLNEVESLAEKAATLHNGVDILFNVGGTIYREPAKSYPYAEWKNVLQVNLDASFLLAQAFAPDMIEKRAGKIINIASMLSFTGGITVPAYTASKHAVVGLTKALANEWGEYNIQVNAIAPGYFKTDNTQALQDNPVRNQEILSRIPAGRWGEPSDLSGAAVFLASEASNYVNGHTLAVDGGWLAR